MSITATLKCPKCWSALEIDAASRCGACRYEPPKRYEEACRAAPILPILAVGFSQSGKTHLLATLTLMLQELSEFLPVAPYEILDAETQTLSQSWSNLRERQQVLEKTQHGSKHHVLVLKGQGFPTLQPRTLILYDMAGEHFHNIGDSHLASLKALADTSTIWFVVSVFDMQKNRHVDHMSEDVANSGNDHPIGVRLRSLFESYAAAMDAMNASLTGRNALLVFTKGDGGSWGPIEGSIDDYLRDNPIDPNKPQYQEDFDLNMYVKGMEEISNQLEEFARSPENLPGGRTFLELVKSRGMRIKCCVTSALGAEPSESRVTDTRYTSTPWAHARVLDPLIWTLHLDKQSSARTVTIMIDAGKGCESVYSLDILPQLHAYLSKAQNVRYAYLGRRSEKVNDLSQPPSFRHPRLIGPHIDDSQLVERIVVLSNGPILDLPDFREDSMARRIALVSTSNNPEAINQWPRHASCYVASGADLPKVIQLFESLTVNAQ